MTKTRTRLSTQAKAIQTYGGPPPQCGPTALRNHRDRGKHTATHTKADRKTHTHTHAEAAVLCDPLSGPSAPTILSGAGSASPVKGKRPLDPEAPLRLPPTPTRSRGSSVAVRKPGQHPCAMSAKTHARLGARSLEASDWKLVGKLPA
jgi:hypothetical protein